jgi:hypothetical protein
MQVAVILLTVTFRNVSRRNAEESYVLCNKKVNIKFNAHDAFLE